MRRAICPRPRRTRLTLAIVGVALLAGCTAAEPTATRSSGTSGTISGSGSADSSTSSSDTSTPCLARSGDDWTYEKYAAKAGTWTVTYAVVRNTCTGPVSLLEFESGVRLGGIDYGEALSVSPVPEDITMFQPGSPAGIPISNSVLEPGESAQIIGAVVLDEVPFPQALPSGVLHYRESGGQRQSLTLDSGLRYAAAATGRAVLTNLENGAGVTLTTRPAPDHTFRLGERSTTRRSDPFG